MDASEREAQESEHTRELAAALELKWLERETTKRETAVDDAQTLIAAENARLERRRSKVTEMEKSLEARVRELDEREARLETREAELQIDVELRTDELDQREIDLAAHEERLIRKERDLQAYVAQVQQQLTRAA